MKIESNNLLVHKRTAARGGQWAWSSGRATNRRRANRGGRRVGNRQHRRHHFARRNRLGKRRLPFIVIVGCLRLEHIRALSRCQVEGIIRFRCRFEFRTAAESDRALVHHVGGVSRIVIELAVLKNHPACFERRIAHATLAEPAFHNGVGLRH